MPRELTNFSFTPRNEFGAVARGFLQTKRVRLIQCSILEFESQSLSESEKRDAPSRRVRVRSLSHKVPGGSFESLQDEIWKLGLFRNEAGAGDSTV